MEIEINIIKILYKIFCNKLFIIINIKCCIFFNIASKVPF